MAKGTYEIRIRVTPEGFELIEGAAHDLRRMEHAADGVDDKFAQINQRLRTMFGGMERLGRKMMLLGTGGVAAFGGIAAVGVKYNAQVEEMTAKLSNFLTTQNEVKEAFRWAQEAVLGTPLMTAEMVNTITILETSGVSYKKWGKVVADTAAAVKGPGESLTGTMDIIAEALGRMKVGETGEAIRTFRRMGINVHDAGLQFDKTGHLVDSTEDALEKLNKYMNTKFGGGMERLGKTWGGLWLAMKGQVIRNLGEALAPTFALLKSRLQTIVDFLRSPAGKEAMKEWGRVLQETFTEAIKMAEEFRKHVFPILIKAAKWFKELSARGRVWLILLPLIGGAALVTAGKLGNLALSLRMIGVFGPLAAKGITGTGTAAAGAAGSFGIYTLAIAAAIAQLYGLIKGSEWIAKKLGFEGWGIVGSAKKELGAVWNFSKNWNPVAGKFGKWGAGKKFVQKPGEGQRPMSQPTGPLSASAAKWAATAGGWGATPPGGGDIGDGGGGGGGGGVGGGGGGGVGTRARGGTVLYQTIEKVIINAKSVDEKSFMKLMGKIVESEAPA